MAAAPSPSPLPGETPPAAATILVVDDEPRNADVIANFLEMEGFRVLSAGDGDQALAMVAGQPPDVILLDVLMPGPDGFEICRRLKADPRTVFIPVVILTALRGAQERIRGAAAGADEFLSKPFDHVELITRVRSLVRTKRLHDQIQAYNAELERRVAERTAELQKALQELQELDRLKSEFIANVSHELRTPLLHVKGYISLLADGVLGRVTDDQARGLGIAQQAIDQLSHVVEDVVDFSDASERRLALEPVSVGDVCRSVVQMLAPRAERRQIQISLALAPDVPMVLADRTALSRVLRHLVDNAVKFSPRASLVEILAERQASQVRIGVRDHGPGIPQDQLPRIFQRFYQGDGSATRKADGMGIGLALVRSLLAAHGAEVHVTSELGRGSFFFFDLPEVE